MGRLDRGGKTPLDTVQARREAQGLRRRPRADGQTFGARGAPLKGHLDGAVRCGAFPHP